MSTKIVMDADGTLFNLYGRKNWLEMLQNEQAGAFTTEGLENNGFMPEINISKLYTVVSRLMEAGVTFCVTTWLPMQASPEYEEICRQEKIAWIRQYLPFVSEINVVSYGIPKQNAIQKRAKKMYLIDDNTEVCKMWETNCSRIAKNVNEFFTVIDALEEILNEE